MRHLPSTLGLNRISSWLVVLLVSSLSLVRPAAAERFPLAEDGSNVVGHLQGLVASRADSFVEIGRRFNVGYEELKLANPGVDPWIPGEGTLVVIPSRYVLPDAPRTGIVLNLAEMRLYYYPEPQDGGPPREVITHPISIGQVGWETPLGTTSVVMKLTDPAWYPSASIRAASAAEGKPLPAVVPPGPDNPLGRHALGLGFRGYFIHATNKPAGLGMRVSRGCVRMYPEDIARMFTDLPVGTPVRIVNQPIKMGWRDGVLFMEAHPGNAELELGGGPSGTDAVRRVVASTSGEQAKLVRWERVAAVAETLTGIPYAVSNASNVQLAQAHSFDLEMIPGDAPVSASLLAVQLDADTVADRRSRMKRGLAQRPYFLENSRIQ
ncbi:MAG: L,D-transpeptidase family protein [Gammaproteobacteria bacterium]|nr:MAG: L,D-transpeptidase family protein [Gammaproteobacteria bacterium]